MTALAGTGAMVRLALRRDRVRLVLWVGGISVLMLSTAAAQMRVYATPEDIAAYAASVGESPAAKALQGAGFGLDTIGGIVAYEGLLFGCVVVALMAVLLVVRHTRAEEEAGRAELLRAAEVGRQAGLAAALAVTTATSAVIGLIVAAGYVALGLPAAGSLATGLALAGVGAVFAGVAATTAQVTEHARAASGAAAAVLGLAFVLRAVGDVGDGRLSWLSPLGWAQRTRPYADERWWPFLLLLALAVLLAVAAAALLAQRDVGAGLVAARPGPAQASRWLTGPGALAVRLQRGAVLGWAAGLLLLGAAYGSVGEEVESLAAENDAIAAFVEQRGVSLTDSFFSTAALMIGLLAAGCAVQATVRARVEESAGRVEPLIATATSRWRWAGSHLAVAAIGATLVLALAGLGLGVTHAVLTSDAGQVPRLVGAALVQAPAVWVLVGLGAALLGLAPRATSAVWGVLGLFVVLGLFGSTLDLPGWLVAASPFDHVPQLPAADVSAAPLVVLTLVAAALGGVGVIGLLRRDVG